MLSGKSAYSCTLALFPKRHRVGAGALAIVVIGTTVEALAVCPILFDNHIAVVALGAFVDVFHKRDVIGHEIADLDLIGADMDV